MIATPRTPTPFKNALAAQEKMHGPLKMEVGVCTMIVCSFFICIYNKHFLHTVYPVACSCGFTSLCIFQPQPLAFLEEDIREVLKQETGSDIFNRTDFQPDYRAWKHNVCACKSSITPTCSVI